MCIINTNVSLTSPTLNRKPDVTLAALFSCSFSPLGFPLSLYRINIRELVHTFDYRQGVNPNAIRANTKITKGIFYFSYNSKSLCIILHAKILTTLKVPWTAATVSAYLSRYPWRLSTCAMGLLRPSAVEHTTGVVFRVGTPGRLAGRCLWPSLSSRKSKATGVIAVPFSSISPLHHLLHSLPSIPFLFLFFPSFVLSVCTYSLSSFLSLSLHVTTFSRRAFTSENPFFPCGVRVLENTRAQRVPGGCRAAAIRSQHGARVKTTKKTK